MSTSRVKPPELSVITDVTDSYEILARATRQAAERGLDKYFIVDADSYDFNSVGGVFALDPPKLIDVMSARPRRPIMHDHNFSFETAQTKVLVVNRFPSKFDGPA